MIIARLSCGVSQAFGAWLKELIAVCKECGIVSIMDEVYVGFRSARPPVPVARCPQSLG